ELPLALPLRCEELGQVRLRPDLEVADPGKAVKVARVATGQRLPALAVCAGLRFPGSRLDPLRRLRPLGPAWSAVDGQYYIKTPHLRAPYGVVQAGEAVCRIAR